MSYAHRWLTVLVLAFAASSTTASAAGDGDVYAGWLQPGPPPIERFVKPLDLSSEQQKKLKPIFDAARAKAAADAEGAKSRVEPADGERVGGVLSQREADFRVQLASVLTSEQMTRYDAVAATRAPSTRTLIPHPAHGHSEGDRDAATEMPK